MRAHAREPDLLAIYLNDHLAGATGGVELARRLASALRSSPDRPVLDQMVKEISEDRMALVRIMNDLEVPINRLKVLAGWAGEKIGRLKFNGRLSARSPLSTLVELEGMLLGVTGKAAGWRTLRTLADVDHRLDSSQLDTLIERAHRQRETLEELRTKSTMAIFGGNRKAE